MKEIVKPSEPQAEWADCEVGVIIHLLAETFEPGYDMRADFDYQPKAENMHPDLLDTDQWVEAAAAAGAKYAVLVAKHGSGLCLWPTKEHDYNISKTTWKNGKGDVVADFVASCKKYGVKPGLYYSVSCNAYKKVDNPGLVISHDPEEQKAYNEMVIRQLTEVWTNYGDFFEIWFDGGCLPVEQGGPDVAGLLRKLQPNAVLFQGPIEMRHGLRWVGNERGVAGEDCWATVNARHDDEDGTVEREDIGNPDGDTWRPAEVDMGNRKQWGLGGGWVWKEGEDDALYSADELFGTYLTSVGRNGNFLIGMAIDDTGRFPEKDTAIFRDFGNKVKEAFGTPLCRIAGDLSDEHYHLESDREASYLVVCENIREGERVLAYETSFGVSGHSIGHKRIFKLPAGTKSVDFNVTEKRGDLHILSVELF